MKLGVIIAVYDEAKQILDDKFYEWIKTGDEYYSQKYDIHLCVTGIGKVYASYGFTKMEDKVDKILILGTSGGLDDEKVGSLYLVTEFVEHDMDVTGLGFEPGLTPFSPMKSPVIKHISPDYENSVKDALKRCGIDYQTGRLISGDLLIHKDDVRILKKELFGAKLVDMESAAVAKLCMTKSKKDVAAVRYISDNASHEAAAQWGENVKKSAFIFNDILKEFIKGI